MGPDGTTEDNLTSAMVVPAAGDGLGQLPGSTTEDALAVPSLVHGLLGGEDTVDGKKLLGIDFSTGEVSFMDPDGATKDDSPSLVLAGGCVEDDKKLTGAVGSLDHGGKPDGSSQQDLVLPLVAQAGVATDEVAKKSMDKKSRAALILAQITAKAEEELSQKVAGGARLTYVEKQAASRLASRGALIDD